MAATVQQMQADDDAYVKQATDAQNAKQSQEALQGGEKPEPSFVSKFMTSVGRASTNTLDWAVSAADSINVMRDRAAHDIGAGVTTAAVNTADAVGSAITSSGKGLAAAEDPAHAEDAQEGSLPTSPIWDHAKSAILDFRDAVAVKDPTLSDNLLQGAAQLAVPFAGYSRAMAGVHGFANLVLAGGLTDATALGPHDPRMADLIALGRHTEGKFGETLRTLAPDGGAVNAYINYLTDRGDETEAAGRFKNVLDGFGANMLVTPLLHAVASGLKYGTAGLRHAVENGVGSASDLMPAPQAGRIGSEPMDMSLSPEQRALERERVAAARDREEGVTQEPTPEPIPANAAAREGAAARRDAAAPGEPAAYSMEDTTPKGWGEADTTITEPRMAIKANDDYLTDLSMKLAAVNEGAAPLKLHDILSDISQNLNPSEPAGAFYKELASRLADKNLSTSITSTKSALGNNVVFGRAGPNTQGMYHLQSDEMGLFPKAFRNNIVMAHTVTHEAVHAATLDALKDTSSGLKDQISSLVVDAKKLWPHEYAVTNEREFVAEAESNPSFQDKLKSTKDASGRTLWDQYKAMIGGVLGLSGAALASPHLDDVLSTKEKTGA